MTVRSTVLSLALGVACEQAPRPAPVIIDQVEQQRALARDDRAPVRTPTVRFDVGWVPPAPPEPRVEPEPRPAATEHHRCGEASRAAPDERPTLRIRPRKRGALDVAVSDFRSWCSPAPSFSAGVVPGAILVAEQTPPAGTPMARCSCLHDLTVTVRELEPGDYEVRLFGRLAGDGDTVPVATAPATVR
jgi:hypothetical protein